MTRKAANGPARGNRLFTMLALWRDDPGFRKRLVTSLVIGIVIELVLIVAHKIELPFLVSTEDTAMDSVMRQYRNISRDSPSAFVLLEADQETYELWDQPFYFHRDRVLDMIRYASGFELAAGGDAVQPSARPAAIIVDIDLSKAGRDDGSEELKAYLGRYGRQSNPPLILARTFSSWPVGDDGDDRQREQVSFLDEVVGDSGNRRVFWASPHFQLDQDRSIRRWFLWRNTKWNDQFRVLPSLQLLTQVLLTGDADTARERHDELLEKLSDPSLCKNETIDLTAHTIAIGAGKHSHVIDLCDNLTAQRLIYAIPYETKLGEERPRINGAPVLSRVPALDLAQLDRRFLDNRIVVLGGTYRETRDWHMTPLGEMPGAMIVVNAIDSLGANGQLHTPHPLLKIAIVILLVLLMTFTFAALKNSFSAYLVASALILVLLMPLSFWWFRSGVWLDFAVPLLAVQLHEFVAEIENIRHERDAVQSKTAVSTTEAEAGPEQQLENSDDSTKSDEPAV